MTREQAITLQALRTVARSPTMFGARRIINDAIELMERMAVENDALTAKIADMYTVIEMIGAKDA